MRQVLNRAFDFSDDAAEQVAAELTDGLKSCRAVLNDYRAAISGGPTADNSNEPELLEQSSSG